MQKALNCVPGTWQTQYLRVIITLLIRCPSALTSCPFPFNCLSPLLICQGEGGLHGTQTSLS